MQSATLHVKIKPELADGLKALAGKRSTSVGELVRRAVISCYQLELLDLGEKQRRAIEAYSGGYISFGKLAEEMGMDVFKLGKWMEEHDIPRSSVFHEDDVKNA